MRKTTLVAAVSLVLFAASALLASVTFTPPAASNTKMNMAMIPLKAQKAAPKASGMVSLIANKDKTTCKLAIEVKGLDPKKVYTAWLVKPGKNGQMMGLGTSPYSLSIDAKGSAKIVTADMDVKAMMSWPTIEIVEHKDGNPNNMKSAVPVLIGDATKLR
jgi:hypothetical protein